MSAALAHVREESPFDGAAPDRLKTFVERIERLHEERAGIVGDIKDIYAELKGEGFNAAAVRHIVKIRGQDHSKRQEFEGLVDLYKTALGMA